MFPSSENWNFVNAKLAINANANTGTFNHVKSAFSKNFILIIVKATMNKNPIVRIADSNPDQKLGLTLFSRVKVVNQSSVLTSRRPIAILIKRACSIDK